MIEIIHTWVRQLLGKEYVVVEGNYDNLYPCKAGMYMVYAPATMLVWKTDMKKDKAYELCNHLNKRK